MLVNEIIEPKSIVVVGGSNDLHKPGGKVLYNLICGGFNGSLYVVNPKEASVQGIQCFPTCKELPQVELAIIAIAAKNVPEAVSVLAKEKGTRAFIVLSAGFSEMGTEGRRLEEEIVGIVREVDGTLIGPNCIGVITKSYKGVFAGPIPDYDPSGCDFVSASGATAVFILEEAITRGIKFSQIFSVGNSAQIGIEEILEFWDTTHNANSSKVKLIYAEQIANPQKFLKHSSSLISKGCRIAAIKAGRTQAGSRAVSSHTGALAGTDEMVEALFRKAGIIRCESRMELVYVAGVLLNKQIKGKRFAIVTHAGGPAVMLTDTMEAEGLAIPPITGSDSVELLKQLHYGSSVSNPIDFLATGTAEQLDVILDYVENKFDNIDASVVIFGTPGLFDVSEVYRVLHSRIIQSRKPIFPVLPSIVQAKKEIELFKSLGGVYFNDEVALGKAIGKVVKAEVFGKTPTPKLIRNNREIRNLIERETNGYLSNMSVRRLLGLAEIPLVKGKIIEEISGLNSALEEVGLPVAMKVVGPLHKTDVGGVRLNIQNYQQAESNFYELMQIEGAYGVEIQQMATGKELFFGVKWESGYGHLIVFGLGGIFVEVLHDVQTSLAPLSFEEAKTMIQSIKGYQLIKGVRGEKPIDEGVLIEILLRISELVEIVPEIREMDINPAFANESNILVADARIRIEK
jgi:acetyltransferase